MLSSAHRNQTELIFLDIESLKIYHLYKQMFFLFMFKYIRDCLPKLFMNYYIRNIDIHSHVTRQQNKQHIHKCRTTAAQKDILCYSVIYGR